MGFITHPPVLPPPTQPSPVTLSLQTITPNSPSETCYISPRYADAKTLTPHAVLGKIIVL